VDFVDVATLAVLAVMGMRLALGARTALGGRGRSRVVAIVRGVRARHLLLAPLVFAVIVFAVVMLMQVPGLDFGWWTALGGTGNPVTGGTDQTAGTTLEWLIPAVFIVLLVPALPLFAEAEERVFRLGSENRSRWGQIGWGVLFGLAHAIVGIPIGAALGLSVAGWYFTWTYLRMYRFTGGNRQAALLESTRAHFAYNAELIVVVIALVLVWR
jgi:hypothetical protein